MTGHLDQAIADRLVKICNMFSSNHTGERASAAAMADSLIRRVGLTWEKIIRADRDHPHKTIEEMIVFALDHGKGIITDWEHGFLRGIYGRQYLTEKQIAKLDAIVRKVKTWRAAA